MPIEGIEPGTFSLEFIHLAHAERGPDIVLTFPWSSAANAFGVPGTDITNTAGATGPLKGNSGNHGSMSPWTVRNTFLAWGADFKHGATVRTPVSNVDVTPTLVALLGLDGDSALPRFDGRAILEALRRRPRSRADPGAHHDLFHRGTRRRLPRRDRGERGGRAALSRQELAGAVNQRRPSHHKVGRKGAPAPSRPGVTKTP